jgi:hypothetical protein
MNRNSKDNPYQQKFWPGRTLAVYECIWMNTTHLQKLTQQYTTETGWYNRIVLPDIDLQDVLRLRKPHACGGFEWRVVRLGADIGLECLTCGRRILLPRRELARRLKTVVTRGPHEPNITP